ncbi:hypothetical protein D9615_004602 [Tricholomella constricta]|uniref:Uncharacterized protein n=1 Tax=Tricholomella constricta TaxID=117010 RepID=A0A8H5HBC6_9AGAR|nr:hypothetical protein D9615_004602 [Tricholomella constricta]
MAPHVENPLQSPTAPTHRRRPLPPNYIGADPYDLIGKVLRRARQSAQHPAVTFEFSDNTSFQILVDGYDPMYPGIPKVLDMDSDLQALFNSGQPLDLPIIGCTFITLLDLAFEAKQNHASDLRWEQQHRGIALKFAEDIPRWRCVGSTMEERDSTGIAALKGTFEPQ